VVCRLAAGIACSGRRKRAAMRSGPRRVPCVPSSGCKARRDIVGAPGRGRMALTAEELRQGFTIGDRVVEPARNRIRGPDGEAHVEPKVMDVLVCLAGRAGEVVTRQALYDAVWGKAIVSDQALTNCISELRHHLGDDRAEPRYIETVPKRGYRLLAPVRPAGDAAPAMPTAPATRRRVPLVLPLLGAV